MVHHIRYEFFTLLELECNLFTSEVPYLYQTQDGLHPSEVTTLIQPSSSPEAIRCEPKFRIELIGELDRHHWSKRLGKR